ncbi:putative lipoprotein [Myxococcus xanthus DK 1622]|uniref:Lipoprotein n=1 Tax=Myxococcus xanthus (strain DK1622) TaxID=246197 RepID=Q1DF05_MYXXD|nr:putative lipoprotein [Myxococcus xanthus DK 1622]
MARPARAQAGVDEAALGPPRWAPWSAVVAVAACGGRHCRGDFDPIAGEHPPTLARSEARREVAVVDLPGHREAVVGRGRKVEARAVTVRALVARRRREALRVAGVDVALGRLDDAVTIRVRDGDRRLVGRHEPLLEVGHTRLEGVKSLEHVQEHLPRDAARNEALAELALRVFLCVEAVRIAREGRVVAELDGPLRVLVEADPIARNDRGLPADLAFLIRGRRVRRRLVGEAAGEGQFVEGVDPVGRVVELPVLVCVGLLERVVRAHAELERHQVRDTVREVVGSARGAGLLAIDGEEVAGHVVATSHLRQQCGVVRGDGPVDRAAVLARLVDFRHAQVVNHPPLVPAALVVDDEKTRDVRDDVDERSRVIRVDREPLLGLQDEAHRSNRRKIAVGARGGEHRRVVDARDERGEDVGLEVVGVEEVVLEQLTRAIGLGVELDGKRTVGSTRKPRELVLQLRRQRRHVPAGHDRCPIGEEVRVAVALRRVLGRVAGARSGLGLALWRQRGGLGGIGTCLRVVAAHQGAGEPQHREAGRGPSNPQPLSRLHATAPFERACGAAAAPGLR